MGFIADLQKSVMKFMPNSIRNDLGAWLMTFTINFPIFPMRREIAERRKRLGLPVDDAAAADAVSKAGSKGANGDARRGNARYSREGFEFDVSALPRIPQGSSSGC